MAMHHELLSLTACTTSQQQQQQDEKEMTDEKQSAISAQVECVLYMYSCNGRVRVGRSTFTSASPFLLFLCRLLHFFLWVGCSEVRKNPPRMKSNERTRRTGGMERRHRTHGERGYGGSFKKLFCESSIALTLAVRRRRRHNWCSSSTIESLRHRRPHFFFLFLKSKKKRKGTSYG